MILARISRAIREQNWFAVALEFVIVVAGVMLAFQFSLMSQRQAEAARVDAQIELVAAEMQTNLERIRSYLDVLENHNANIRELRVSLSGDLDEADPAQLDRLALFAFMDPGLEIETFALDRLERLDGRQTLSGSPLETALSEWRQVHRGTRDVADNISSLIEATNAGASFHDLSIEALVQAFPSIGLVEPVPSRFHSDWQALSRDPVFAGHLAVTALNLEYLWREYQRLKAASQHVLDAIEERRSR